MTSPTQLIAQANRVGYLFRDAFPPKGRDSTETLKTMVVVVLAFASSIALVYVLRHVRTKTRESPSIQAVRLFRQCLRQLGLRFTDRILMGLAARRCALDEPIVMLFSPELLERHAGRWAAKLPTGPLRHWATNRILDLTPVLFGAPSGADEPVRQPVHGQL